MRPSGGLPLRAPFPINLGVDELPKVVLPDDSQSCSPDVPGRGSLVEPAGLGVSFGKSLSLKLLPLLLGQHLPHLGDLLLKLFLAIPLGLLLPFGLKLPLLPFPLGSLPALSLGLGLKSLQGGIVTPDCRSEIAARVLLELLRVL